MARRARRLVVARAAEAGATAWRRGEVLDHVEIHVHHGHENHLRDAIARIDRERRRAPIPAGHQQRALVVGVDQADEIAEHDAVLVSKPGARQQHRRQFRILDVNRYARGNELGGARDERERRIEAGAKIHAGRAGSRVMGQRELASDARIEDAHFHRAFHVRRDCRVMEACRS
jgi:hypothetical protein